MKHLLAAIIITLSMLGVAIAQTPGPIQFSATGAPMTPILPVSYFGWQGINPTLPSEQVCAEEIAYSPEGIPSNVPMNAYVPTSGQLATFQANPIGTLTGISPTSDYSRVTGDYASLINRVPSTDMLIRWMACKYGLDEETMRAESWQESGWRQDTLGDPQAGSAICTQASIPQSIYDVNITFLNGTMGHEPGGCWTSYSILQDKVMPGYTTSYPTLAMSTAFEMDLRGSAIRACINGDQITWFQNQGTCTTPKSGHGVCTEGQGTPTSAQILDLEQGCVATHFNGDWWSTPDVGYWNSINALITNPSKPWPGGK